MVYVLGFLKLGQFQKKAWKTLVESSSNMKKSRRSDKLLILAMLFLRTECCKT